MKFENKTFTTDVTLDYNEFTDCLIKDCKVVFHGGDFSLARTKLENVKFTLAGPAHNTLAFLRLVRAAGAQALDDLLNQGPQPTPDQGVTIN